MGNVAKVIAVTGLQREGAVLRELGLTVFPGGGAPDQLARKLKQAAQDAAGIVSFGMAGALDPSLRLGDWVIGESLAGAWQGACDPQWVAALAARLPAARIGPCYADGQLIADPVRKCELGQGMGVLAADMESHIAAHAAAAAGLPFAILRCVSDEASAAMPPAIAVAMKPGGGLALGAVLGSILKQPGQLPALMQSVAGFNRAYKSLQAGARVAGPNLAFDQR